MADTETLRRAVALASSGDWQAAHKIVQTDDADPMSCWLHACLHRIEGDLENARYWYARARRHLEDFPDEKSELAAIARSLE